MNPILDKVLNKPKLRRALMSQSHDHFFHYYFRHYVKFPTADFQKEMLSLTQTPPVNNLAFLAFRNSSKSSIVTTSLPIWSMIGQPRKKYILIASRIQQQARQHLKNIRAELENNTRLIADFGPFYSTDGDWSNFSLVIPKLEARLSVVSVDQSVRGMRHLEHRPDLIVGDDLEDIESVRTQEGRDKTFNWLVNEILPMGSEDTQVILLGNLAHRDGIMARLEKASKEKGFPFLLKRYSIVDEDGLPLWPGRFPNYDALEKFKDSVPSEKAWNEEYLLKPPEAEAQLFRPEWLQTYANSELPTGKHPRFRFYYIGVDLAIKLTEAANKTAIVPMIVIGSGKDMKIFVLPNIINRKMTHLETLDCVEKLAKSLGSLTFVSAEDVAYQGSFGEQLNRRRIKCEPFQIGGRDKYARAASVSHLVQSGTVVFPEHGAEELKKQLLAFPNSREDDLVDALTIGLHKILEKKPPPNYEVCGF